MSTLVEKRKHLYTHTENWAVELDGYGLIEAFTKEGGQEIQLIQQQTNVVMCDMILEYAMNSKQGTMQGNYID